MEIVVTKMNSGTKKERYQYSNKAEKAIIDAINPYSRRDFTHIYSDRVFHGDFYIDDIELGDIKVGQSPRFYIELAQVQSVGVINGWFLDYKHDPEINMEWLMFVNSGNSTKYGDVWKVRLIPFDLIVEWMHDNVKTQNDYTTRKDGSAYCYISPTEFGRNDGWIGDFDKPREGVIDTKVFRVAPNAFF